MNGEEHGHGVHCVAASMVYVHWPYEHATAVPVGGVQYPASHCAPHDEPCATGGAHEGAVKPVGSCGGLSQRHSAQPETDPDHCPYEHAIVDLAPVDPDEDGDGATGAAATAQYPGAHIAVHVSPCALPLHMREYAVYVSVYAGHAHGVHPTHWPIHRPKSHVSVPLAPQ